MRTLWSWLAARRELLLLAVFAAILAWQLLLPGFIGIANNGDFSKVSGRWCIAVTDDEGNEHFYFQSVYARRAGSCWDSEMPSSEVALAWLATSLQTLVGDPARFDIRWLGALHAAGFLFAFWLWIRLLRPVPGFAWLSIAAVAVVVFADTGNVAYANTFYTDTAALIGAMAAVPAAVLLARERRPLWLLLFIAAALLFVASKAQHAVFAVIPAVFLLAMALCAGERKFRIAAMIAAIGIPAAAGWVLAATPAWYFQVNRFNVEFHRILPSAAAPPAEARELGISPADLQYSGMHSFQRDSPMVNPDWLRHFDSTSSTWRLLKFYLRRPGQTIAFLRQNLIEDARSRRSTDLGNFRREAGHPASALSQRFGLWDFVRSWMFRQWPWHIVVWYALLIFGAPVRLLRESNRERRAILWTVWGIALAGAGEFCMASLADALDTGRHLLLFHVFTDCTFLLGLVLVSGNRANGRGSAQSPEPPRSAA